MSEFDNNYYSNISDFCEKLDSIEYINIISLEGFPIEFSKKLTREKAEAAAALAIDLLYGSREAAKDLLGKEAQEIILDVGDGSVLDVRKIKELILLVKGKRRNVEEALQSISLYLNNKKISCPYCKNNLTFAVSSCPKCSRIIPFTSRTCPSCGYNVAIKKCPYCNKLISFKGQPIRIKKDTIDTSFAIIEGSILGIASSIYFYISTNTIPISIIGGIAIGGLTSYLLYRRARVKIEADDLE